MNNHKVWGPLVFASMLFLISSIIKLIAFKNNSFYIEMPSEFSLWAVGILFSLSVSEQTIFGGKTGYQISKKQSGTGIEVDYQVILPDQLEFTPKYIYLFVFSMSVWIICLLLCGQANTYLHATQPEINLCALVTVIAYMIAGLSIGIALKALVEVGQ